VELFRSGPVTLEGVQKKRFLEENPPIQWSEAVPELILLDAIGCLAQLTDKVWERDLLDVGFSRKGADQYYCPTDQVRAALRFLVELGWRVLDFRKRRVVLQTGVHFSVSEKEGQIAVQGRVQFGEKDLLLRFVKTGHSWAEIDAGTVGLIDRIPILEGKWEKEELLIPKHRAVQLEPLFDLPQTEWEETVKTFVAGFSRSVESAPPAPSFRAKLLPYQQKGVDWLNFLHRWGFSGLLADEMGLGKTVQVLAFFSRLQTNLPVLIVAPTSLLFHWRLELERFLGEKAYVYAGPDRKWDAQQRWILTSYAILRLDGTFLAQQCFEVIVLDESNAIKTSATQVAQAAYQLQGNMKLALTGTPVENRPEELYSQFRFLLPDLEPTPQKLRPFLLRRRKDEVQLDLPDKIEQICWIEMEAEQKALYDSYRTRLRSQLGEEPKRMEVLEAILRLRQICCDPALVGEAVTSAKMTYLLGALEEILAEQRKILIYSQFTSMLQRILVELRARNLQVFYLDGNTPSSEREAQVKQFQEDPDRSVFLLSLKAGGVGLNLTAADYVILFDPWWNEAVENQAIDRAHRLGQKKTVIAQRYLIAGSIEEKMLQIKAQKRKTAEQLLDHQDGDFSWTQEDLLSLFH
jgi:SNF2 family DNA or RNA helicase